jgi:hypothetical protein
MRSLDMEYPRLSEAQQKELQEMRKLLVKRPAPAPENRRRSPYTAACLCSSSVE